MHDLQANTSALTVDLARVHEAADGDRQFVKELFEIFLEDTAANLDRVAELLRNGDLDGIRARAHAIKGASGNVGANRMQALAQQLEQLAQRADSHPLQGILDTLQTEFMAVNEFLQVYLADL